MNAYSAKIGQDVSSMKFAFDGNTIKHDDTAQSLGIENEDQIDVFVVKK